MVMPGETLTIGKPWDIPGASMYPVGAEEVMKSSTMLKRISKSQSFRVTVLQVTGRGMTVRLDPPFAMIRVFIPGPV